MFEINASVNLPYTLVIGSPSTLKGEEHFTSTCISVEAPSALTSDSLYQLQGRNLSYSFSLHSLLLTERA